MLYLLSPTLNPTTTIKKDKKEKFDFSSCVSTTYVSSFHSQKSFSSHSPTACNPFSSNLSHNNLPETKHLFFRKFKSHSPNLIFLDCNIWRVDHCFIWQHLYFLDSEITHGILVSPFLTGYFVHSMSLDWILRIRVFKLCQSHHLLPIYTLFQDEFIPSSGLISCDSQVYISTCKFSNWAPRFLDPVAYLTIWIDVE